MSNYRYHGEGRVSTFKGALQRAVDILNNPPPRSVFLRFARNITCEVLGKTDGDASGSVLASHCGWSNLAKIGDTKSNPTRESLAIQADLCVEALRAEIACFQPTGIVIGSGEFAQHEVLEPVFGAKGWCSDNAEGDRVAYNLDPITGSAVVWTNYPVGMKPAGTLAYVQTFAADLIVMAMRKQPLPPCKA